jgi:hypothetical protein
MVEPATTFRLAKRFAQAHLLAALLALSGAPLAFSQSAQLSPESLFSSSAPPGLQSIAKKMEGEITSILLEARIWTGLQPDLRPFQLEWVSGRKELEESLGRQAPNWFAAVAVPSERRLVIATEIAGSQEQLRATLRHELMHLAMMDMGAEAFRSSPSWFHEGCAEVFAGDIYLKGASESISWMAAAGSLPALADYRKGFPNSPVLAATGYALGHAFVERYIRLYGQPALQEVLALLRTGEELDSALIQTTGLSIVTEEKALQEELRGLAGLGGDLYSRLFLGLAVFIVIAFPILRATRKRRKAELEGQWEGDESSASPYAGLRRIGWPIRKYPRSERPSKDEK